MKQTIYAALAAAVLLLVGGAATVQAQAYHMYGWYNNTSWKPLVVDASGNMAASCTVSTVIEDVAESGADTLMLVGAVRRDTAASSSGTTGDFSTINVDANGRLYVIPANNGIEDAAETAAGNLGMVGTVRRDTAASSAGTTGDNATLNTDALGKAWVTGSYAEDAAHTSADTGMFVMSVRTDTQAASAGTTGDYQALQSDAKGALYTIQTGAAAITCGNENIEAAGTAEQLGSNAAKECIVSCPAANTSPCYVRGSTGNGVTGGMVVAKGTSVTLKVNNSNLLWVDAGTNDDDVTWCCTN